MKCILFVICKLFDLLSLEFPCLSVLNFTVCSLRLLVRDGDLIANVIKRSETNKFYAKNQSYCRKNCKKV